MMGGYGNYGYGFGNQMFGGGWLGLILMLVFGAAVVAGVVLLIVWMVRSSAGHAHPTGAAAPPTGAAGHDEAVSIAKRRLAGGEINKEQYDEIMRTLSS